MIKLRCEDFDELIYLFWDGQLDERKKEGLKKHLSTCNRCKERLALLESIEQKAKGIKIKEPSQEYWETFSNRVRERIIAQKEESFSFKLKRVFENLITFSPLKIKIAAGLVSMVFVFIVGKLYMDYRGKQIIPSEISIEKTKELAFHAPIVEKKVTDSIELKEMAKPKEAAIPQESKFEKKDLIVLPYEELRSEEVSTLETKRKEEKLPAQVELRKTEIPPGGKVQKEEELVPPTKELKEETLLIETYSAGAGAKEKGKMSRDIIQPEKKALNVESVPLRETTKTAGAETSYSEILAYTVGFVKHYDVNNEKVPELKYTYPLPKEEELRKIIDTWNKYIEKAPNDSLANEGYLQVAIGYYLLFKLTRDESLLSKGIELLEKYEKQITDPKTKEELNKKSKQLKALK